MAQGEPVWNFITQPCEVLYLCLEDSFQRIQSRLFDLTESAPPTLHFVVMSEQLHSGLLDQIEQFLKERPNTGLVVIDTLQRIRSAGNEANPYASDYRDVGVLKALADQYCIAILLIHHLRKLNDDDPINMISGTTGLSGATDSNFVLRKNKRRDYTATLYCTGRDIAYRELSLEFDGESHIWRLLANSCEQDEQSDGRLTILLLNLLREQGEFIGTPTELSEKIDPDKQEGVTPKKVARLILQSVETLRRTGITAIIRRSNGKRIIELHRAESDDLADAGEIVPIDPATLNQTADETAERPGNEESSLQGGQAERLSDFVGLGAAGTPAYSGQKPGPTLRRCE